MNCLCESDLYISVGGALAWIIIEDGDHPASSRGCVPHGCCGGGGGGSGRGGGGGGGTSSLAGSCQLTERGKQYSLTSDQRSNT